MKTFCCQTTIIIINPNMWDFVDFSLNANHLSQNQQFLCQNSLLMYQQQFIFSQMRSFTFLLASILINLSTCLITLKNSTINLDYQIGGIQNLYLHLQGSIFFTSMSNIFGFFNPTDGSVTSAYRLESDEKIIRFHGTNQVIIAKGKYLNIFNIQQAKYNQFNQNKYLKDHQDFDTIEDFVRAGDGSNYILTNTYLMKILEKSVGMDPQKKSEEIIIQANSQQKFYSLCPFYNYNIGKDDRYLSSTRPAQKDIDLCFRKVQELNKDPFCFNIPQDRPILDIIYSSGHIFVVFKEKSLLLTPRLQFVTRIQGKISQYFHGFVGLADKFESFNLPSKETVSFKIITESYGGVQLIRALALVNETIVVRNYAEDKETNDIVVIDRNASIPRKAWTKTSTTNNKQFNLFIEFQNGKLACFDIDQSISKQEKRWEVQVGAASLTDGSQKKVDESNDIQINDNL